MPPRPPTSTLFPYTTLFRSVAETVRLGSKLGTQYGVSIKVETPLIAMTKAEIVRAAVEAGAPLEDRKSTRLNSSHLVISYAVFCLKKKNIKNKAVNRHKGKH